MGNRSRPVGELPLDLTAYHILTRLPIKSLSRFKCVSKPWHSFISDPHFQEHHLRRAQQTPLLLVAQTDSSISLVRLSTYSSSTNNQPFFNLQKHICIRTNGVLRGTLDLFKSCRGLVCLTIWPRLSILVCNPSTEEILTLPPAPVQELDLCVGFGYAASSDHFKVVRFFTLLADDNNSFCKVFTLGTAQGWREARSPPPYMPQFREHPPFVHGALHLFPDDLQVQHGHQIAVFDVETEEFRAIPLPGAYFPGATRKKYSSPLAELRGFLCLTLEFEEPKMLQLWFLNDYHGGKWVKQYSIDISWAISCIRASPLAIADNGLILINLKSKTNANELCLYNPQENLFEGVMGVNCSAAYYVESFMSLGCR